MSTTIGFDVAVNSLCESCRELKLVGITRDEIIRGLLMTAAVEMLLARSPEAVDESLVTPAVEAAMEAMQKEIG